jgi:hypothetical protein
MAPRDVEKWYVYLVALHSFSVGIALAFFPRWSAAFGGWGDARPVFFICQGGAFHLVVATGYIMEYAKTRTLHLMIFAKLVGTVFLTAAWVLDSNFAWAVPFSALGDAVMAVLAVVISRRADRTD